MLSFVACSCVRNGRKVSVSRLSIFSTASKSSSPLTLPGGLDLSQHRSCWVFTPAPSRLPAAPSSRFVSSRKDAETSGCPSDPPDGDNLGSMSADMASRRSFKKSSPGIQDLKYREYAAVEEEEDLSRPPRRSGRRNTPYWYFLQCKKLIKENKLQEALDVFSRDMLQGERLQPEEFNYSVLIGGCGRAGHLKKAFRLYNDMKKRGLEASDATYTALFNACAESPSKQAGLQQALKLEQELRRRNHPLSTITYHALLKAHAVTNHLQACIQTFREMLQNGHAVTPETFHHLLMGCWKDKETGFRLALQVWRQMLRSGILPDAKNHNLLLRAARDCGIGDPAVAANLLLETDSERRQHRGDVCKGVMDIDLLEKQLFIQPDPLSVHQQDGRGSEELSSQLIPVRQTENFSLPVELPADSSAPNLLDLFEGKRGAVVSLGTVDGASDRLSLIGGAKGFLEKMAADGLSPDLRTLTLLADTMEPGSQSLQVLLKAAKRHRVKLDVAFFNSAIRRAARARNPEDAKAVLHVMRQRNVDVNVQTFGCLALACDRQKDGLQLLEDIEDARLRPNVHVFSALIGQAARRLDYVYLKRILRSMREMGVWPNEVIIKQLEFAAQYPPNYNQYKSRNNYLVQIDGFRGYYQQWLKDLPAQSAEEEQPEAEGAVPNTDAADGLTGAQRNKRAAARRYHSRHGDGTSRTASAL
ncbi:pentatricopeptide repeat-containing protein 1, mitochondrial [Odontesthes bonariensis]|uniref:pentatricopeptide repeat-containing protein 1, mitochondrial n=1 Tax=Odontesthes bonariensis TaxID=219752 RepID=UPI003F585AB7